MLMNMKELLAVANEHNFAIPAFNIGTGQMLTGIIAECEAQKSPVILAIHPLELKFQGDAFIQQVIKAANDTKIPCVIHLDHSGLKDIERAIRDGFTSVMIDASHESFEDNVAITKKVVELAHPLGVSVEAELGCVGFGRLSDAAKGNIIDFLSDHDPHQRGVYGKMPTAGMQGYGDKLEEYMILFGSAGQW